MKTLPFLLSIFGLMLLSACGVPRAALDQARTAAAQNTLSSSPEQTRQALLDQAALWQNFTDTLHRHVLGGIWGVDAAFLDTADHLAAIARRQGELIRQNADDPTLNAALLTEFQNRWRQAQAYLER